MKWWKIDPIESNGIDAKHKQTDDLYNGDRPCDIMAGAIAEIVVEYEREWNRPATKWELRACFNFVIQRMGDPVD